jgi:hypothetical protein
VASLSMIAIAWYFLSRVPFPSLRPINSQRLTLSELIVLLVICFVLYGVSLPPVNTRPRGQPPVTAPAPQRLNQSLQLSEWLSLCMFEQERQRLIVRLSLELPPALHVRSVNAVQRMLLAN